MANLEMPLWPEEWRQAPVGAANDSNDTVQINSDKMSSGILAGLPAPRDWTLADSSIHMIMPSSEVEKIDFSGKAQPEVPPWEAGQATDHPSPPSQPDRGFYIGLTPYHPDLRGDDQDASYGEAAVPPVAYGRPTDQWRQLPQPAELEAGEGGSGYYTYGTDKSEKAGTTANAQWGQPKTMQVIGAVAGKLATGDQYTPFGVGNISLQGGADFRPDHKGHRDGLGIDVRPARVDGAQSPVTYKDPGYDRAATQRLVDAFRATGQVSTIYFNDPQIHGVMPQSKHDDHLHVLLRP